MSAQTKDTKDLFNLDACVTIARYAASIGVDDAAGTFSSVDDPDTTWEIQVRLVSSSSDKPPTKE